MNITSFKYTKADGKTSQRTLYPIIRPNKMIEGIDISELEDIDQADFVVKMEQAREAYIEQMKVIQADFDVVKNYRRFDPTKMTDIIEETL